jgi:hypothetical protein
MTKPIDLISRALKDIGALEAGEQPTPEAATDAFDMLNDLIDQWSNENMMVYNVTEIIFPILPGQVQYTIGPAPTTENFVGSIITGQILGNILTITGIESGAVAQGQTLKGLGIPPGIKIVQFLTGAGGNVNEVGTYQLNAPATTVPPVFEGSITDNILTVTAVNAGFINVGSVLSDTSLLLAPGTTVTGLLTGTGGVGTYTVNITQNVPSEVMTGTATPFQITLYYQKPLSIDSAYVRINTNSNGVPILNGGLDYQVGILALDNYNQIGLKTLNGPWPKALYYNPNADQGNLFVWPNPAQGEMHLFANTIFSRYETLYDTIVLPQGYSMALRWSLAERLMPMYGKVNQIQIQMINAYAANSKATLKRTNMKPVASASYPSSLLFGRAQDAGWILNGGFTN